ncbi:MAG: hypothetical protein JWQ97_3193 [Phenylobacterium sp.]|nr:hypothetical protein [Phenylobacterium sp.]
MTDERAAAVAKPQAREAAPISLWAMAVFALLPFPVAAGVYGYGPPAAAREAVTVLLTWSAVVLSFLAGVRWGLESGRRAPRRLRLVGALGFAMVAWALLLARWRLDLAWILTAYLAAFMLQWLSDHAAPNPASRFPRLSTAVTAAACVSLAVALDQAIRS